MAGPRLVNKSTDRREAILDSAQMLFAEQGYDVTSIGDIIARTGISRGGFYHYFSAKEDLLQAIACRYAATSAREAEEAVADPTLDAFSRLSAFFRAMQRHKIDNAEQLRSTFAPFLRAENAQLHERTQWAILDHVRPTLVRIIREGVADKTFDTPSPDGAADIIMHLLTSNRPRVLEMCEARDKREFDRLAAQLRTQLDYLATVIDRTLGLPEGSLELFDQDSLDLLLQVADSTSDAA